MPRLKRRECNVIYQVEFKPRAIKDLKALPTAEHRRVISKLEALQNDLGGDVKQLTNFTPEYRLRVGHLGRWLRAADARADAIRRRRPLATA